ncbi:hypothetical protein LOD99_15270 [Oopsacas minuta]|uniref:DUSP domain-containing protein n=1 Tax=Oopsacas minuta TaxID=111878 RepID=A0AAV7KC64_9METZ|nr:hypothetical protein LOD99_15270 [Oopsacas minuta]
MAVEFPPKLEANLDLTTDQNSLTFQEARDSIKAQFVIYRNLLDKKELDLLSEIDQLEENNKPELIHVKHDLTRLHGVIGTLGESLGTDTLKLFLEEQKTVWQKQILDFQRSEKLLSRVILKNSDFENFVQNVNQIVPFWSKAKFRIELEPILEVKPKIGEDWYIVSKKWFSDFTDSINLTAPKPNDSWEFPERIPIDHSRIYANGLLCDVNDCKVLHSKAWKLLLEFNGLSLNTIPIKRRSYPHSITHIRVPISPTIHKCTLGHNSKNSKFSIECEIRTFPYETYNNILKKLSPFCSLFTTHIPILYSIGGTYNISCNPPQYTQYNISKPSNQVLVQPAPESPVGIIPQTLLLIIPDAMGVNYFQVPL